MASNKYNQVGVFKNEARTLHRYKFNNFENIKAAAECGYSYAELPAKSIAKLSHGGIKELKKNKLIRNNSRSANSYFPNELEFVGDDVDIEIIKRLCKIRFRKSCRLSALKTAVFGSGPSRAIPSGYSKEKAFLQIEQTRCIVNEESLNWGIEIVIEPLTPSETNMFNTVRETYDFCKKINLKNVHLLADLYHVGQERDFRRSMSDIAECGDELKHVHIACPIARTVPMKCDGF